MKMIAGSLAARSRKLGELLHLLAPRPRGLRHGLLAAAALATVAVLPGCATAQDDRYAIAQAVTGTLPVNAPLGTPGNGDFRACVEGLWPAAQARGVSRKTFDLALASETPDMRILTLLDTQPEFQRPIWAYIADLVSANRIAEGRKKLVEHKALLDRAEQKFGVDRHVIVAIWGMETSYGKAIGNRSVIRSTATLACFGRRQEFFRKELLDALEIVHKGDISLAHLKGSWAGAFGHTQFMPSTFKLSAVDFDGDGRADLVTSIPDVVASTMNDFRNNGWTPGQTWGYEVVLPAGFDYLHADRNKQLTIAEWHRLGVRRAGDKPFPRTSDKANLMLPAGANGPVFLLLDNFKAIMKYNPAEAYSLAIGHLSDRLRGGGPFVKAWPTHEKPLSRDDRFDLQRRLAQQGFDVGDPDGKLGARTRDALKLFQARTGMVPDGFATQAVLARLRR